MRLAEYPRVTVILRDAPHRLTEIVLGTVAELELDLAIEVTRNSANFAMLGSYIREFPTVAIGAGTIVTPEDAQAAADAGCEFVLSPVVLAEGVIAQCHDQGMLVVSGAYSPTEIHAAAARGADIVKVFPLRGLPAQYVRDMRAPLGPIPIMGVGGVTIDSMTELFASGIDYVGIGSGLFGAPTDRLSPADVKRALIGLAAAAAP